MYDFRCGEGLSNQQAQDVALGGPALTLVIAGTLSLIPRSHGIFLSFRCLVHLPPPLRFSHFLVQKEALTASFLLPEKFIPHVSDSFAFIETRNLQCPKTLSTIFFFPFLETGSCVWRKTNS